MWVPRGPLACTGALRSGQGWAGVVDGAAQLCVESSWGWRARLLGHWSAVAVCWAGPGAGARAPSRGERERTRGRELRFLEDSGTWEGARVGSTMSEVSEAGQGRALGARWPMRSVWPALPSCAERPHPPLPALCQVPWAEVSEHRVGGAVSEGQGRAAWPGLRLEACGEEELELTAKPGLRNVGRREARGSLLSRDLRPFLWMLGFGFGFDVERFKGVSPTPVDGSGALAASRPGSDSWDVGARGTLGLGAGPGLVEAGLRVTVLQLPSPCQPGLRPPDHHLPQPPDPRWSRALGSPGIPAWPCDLQGLKTAGMRVGGVVALCLACAQPCELT